MISPGTWVQVGEQLGRVKIDCGDVVFVVLESVCHDLEKFREFGSSPVKVEEIVKVEEDKD